MFFYKEIKKNIYIKQLNKFKNKTNYIYKLKQALYGLKQILKVWFKILLEFLAIKKFKPLLVNYKIFINKKTKVFIVIYINNLLIIRKNITKIKNIKTVFNK